jgi:RteC protein
MKYVLTVTSSISTISELLKRIERLEAYCFDENNKINKSDESLSLPPFQWTASKANLIELIYALQSAGVFNNGQIGIKRIAEVFENLFQIDLGNYYHVFNEMRLRKKNRTSLLDHLKEKIIQKMDTMDEK